MNRLIQAMVFMTFLGFMVSNATGQNTRFIWSNGDAADSEFTTSGNWGGEAADGTNLPGDIVDTGGPNATNVIIQGGAAVTDHTVDFTATNAFDVLIVRSGATLNIGADLIADTQFLTGQSPGTDTINHSAGLFDVNNFNVNSSGVVDYNLSGTGAIDALDVVLNGAAGTNFSVQGDMTSFDAASLVIGSNSTLEFELGATGTNAIELTGAFDPNGGSLVVDGSSYTGATTPGTIIPLVNYATETSQFSGGVTLTGLANAIVVYDGSTTSIQFVEAIPEPGSGVLLTLGMVGMLMRRKRA